MSSTKFPNLTSRITSKELPDEQINKFIEEFEGLDADTKQSRRLGSGADAIAYQIPDTEYVLKLPNKEKNYNLSSLENNYLYSKQLGRHSQVEQPVLVKRPGNDDVLIQRQVKTLKDIPESPSDEFYNSLYDNHPTDEARKQARKNEYKRIDNLPENKAYRDYLKQLDDGGILEGDIHRNNVGIDKSGNLTNFDTGKFFLDEDLAKTKLQNDGLSKMRETFSDNMDKLTKNRVFRSVAAGLPLAGTAMALSSGDANAAMEELPGEIPFLGQAYEAIRPTAAGDANDDYERMNEVRALQNYDKSPARFDKLKSMMKK